MRRLFNYIPSICLCFTLGVVISTCSNLINGYTNMSNLGILYYFILVVAVHFITAAVSKINFKTYRAYHITNFLAIYIFFLISNYFFRFTSLTFEALITNLIWSLLMYSLIYSYYNKKNKLEAEEINKKISKS